MTDLWDDGGHWDDGGIWDNLGGEARGILIGRRDFVRHQAVTFDETVGVWERSLTNLQDLNPQVVAEAHDGDPTSSRFAIDLGYERRVSVFSLINLRTSSSSLFRLAAGLDSTFATNVYETGILPGWPRDKEPYTYQPWGELTVNGVYDDEEYEGFGLNRFIIPPETITIRYILVEVRDTTGPTLQLGCFGAWECWEPSHNFSPDWTLTFVDPSEINRTPHGSTYITEHPLIRQMNFAFKAMPRSEVQSIILGLVAMKRQSRPLIVIPFPDDETSLEKWSIYGLLNQNSSFTNPFFGGEEYFDNVFTIQQLT